MRGGVLLHICCYTGGLLVSFTLVQPMKRFLGDMSNRINHSDIIGYLTVFHTFTEQKFFMKRCEFL